MLYSYMRQVQRFTHDTLQVSLNPQDIIDYINRARREVAMRSQSIRALTPISGGITLINVTNGGTGYSAAPTVTISAPDAPSGQQPFPAGAQATANITSTMGVITAIGVTYGGAGYFSPAVTITDATGTGATATAITAQIQETQGNQEVYTFATAPLASFPGVGSVFAVKSVSIIFNNFRYSLPCYDFSTYQAMIRQYPYQYQYVPAVCGQYGQGVAGSLYLYPIASTKYQMEWDCFCLPIDMATDQDIEALPMPWTEAVPYFAAHLAFLELQNLNAARYYLDLYDNMVHRYSAYARPGRATSLVGRF